MKKKLSHINQDGDIQMVDVGHKTDTKRQATAVATLLLPDAVWKELNNEDIITKKGSVFQTAKLAGIMGAKSTANLIPLCHPLPINKCDVNLKVQNDNKIDIYCTVATYGKTGVEMEALTGASIAALTFYDMCKALSHDIRILDTHLVEKTGGKSDFKRND